MNNINRFNFIFISVYINCIFAPKNGGNGAWKTHFLRTRRGLETFALALSCSCAFIFATCRVEFIAQSNIEFSAIEFLFCIYA